MPPFLGRVKALVDLSTPLYVGNRERNNLAPLRYQTDENLEVRINLKGLYDLFACAASIIREIPEQGSRTRAILMCIQIFITMSDFDDIETDKLKEILRSVADIPNEDFREEASLEHIEDFVSGKKV